jgi:Uma2 family endonuclease
MEPLDSPKIRYTVEAYFGLVGRGVLSADDHVELLDGVIISEPPPDPEHAAGTTMADDAVRKAIGDRASVRVQQPLRLGAYSAPEPDLAVVPGRASDYAHQHPGTAHLVLEVAHSSLPKDRLSKSRIYAAANIPEYWIVNLRDDCVEVFRDPDSAQRAYATTQIAQRGERLDLTALPGASVAVDDLLPPRS